MRRKLLLVVIVMLTLQVCARTQEDSVYGQAIHLSFRAHFGEFSETHWSTFSSSYVCILKNRRKQTSTTKPQLRIIYGGGIMVSMGKQENINGSQFKNPLLVIPNLIAGLSINRSRVTYSLITGPGLGFYGRQRPFFVIGEFGANFHLTDSWGLIAIAGVAGEPGTRGLFSAGIGLSKNF